MVASIEAPFALLQEPVKVLFPDPVKSTQMPLGLVPEVLDTVDVIVPVGEEFGMIDPVMVEARNVQGVVSAEGVGIDDAVRRDLLLDNRQKCPGPGIGNQGRIDLSTPF